MSNLKLQKKLAKKVAKAGGQRVKLVGESGDIKEAITKADIRELIKDGSIEIEQKKGISRHRARKRHIQRKKGRQRGHGHRKGKAGARTPKKRAWINKIRLQRKTIKELKDKLSKENHRQLYSKAKSGFFRSKQHLLLFVKQKKMVEEKK